MPVAEGAVWAQTFRTPREPNAEHSATPAVFLLRFRRFPNSRKSIAKVCLKASIAFAFH
jgi:hypothetical protein